MAMAHFFSLSFEPIPFLLVDGILTYYKYLPGASVVRVLVRCSSKCEDETCKEKKKEEDQLPTAAAVWNQGHVHVLCGRACVPACLRAEELCVCLRERVVRQGRLGTRCCGCASICPCGRTQAFLCLDFRFHLWCDQAAWCMLVCVVSCS